MSRAGRPIDGRARKHVAVLCLGTRGDVQPYVALAQALELAGYRVTVAAGDDFMDFVNGHGVEGWPLGASFRELVHSPEGRAALAGSPQAALAALKPMVARAARRAGELVSNADAVVSHPVLTFVEDLARKRSIPLVRAVASVPVMVPGPAVYGYSPVVLPPGPDWPDDVVVTGYWRPVETDAWTPPRELVGFIESGAPPVYVGFGSMSAVQPDALASLVGEALEIAGCRGVLATGWGGLSPSVHSENLFLVREVDHGWLFPRVAAVVQHGGAGTIGASLRAGKPTVVCPFGLDQPFWGQVVQKLGAGPRALPQRELTAPSLAAAIRAAVFSEDYREKASCIGEKIRREHGAGDAARFIHRYLEGRSST